MNVNNSTGEIFVFPGPYSKRKKTAVDLSNKFEEVYEEIPPYSVDISTGELINKTAEPIIRLVGKKNIWETIQSFKDEVDIYKILERVSVSGDSSLLNRRIGYFGDFINLPDNINDFNTYVKKVFKENENVSKDILEAAINKSLGSDEIAAIISKHVQEAVIASKKNNINNTEVAE